MLYAYVCMYVCSYFVIFVMHTCMHIFMYLQIKKSDVMHTLSKWEGSVHTYIIHECDVYDVMHFELRCTFEIF